MPVRFQPKCLTELALDQIVHCLISACFGINVTNTVMTQPELIARARSRLRPYWSNRNLPSDLRRAILNKCTESLDQLIPEGYLTCRAQSYAPVYVLNILLDTDIHELKVQLCCYFECDHKNALLEVLATDYAKGLTSLELIRSKVSYLDPQLFRPIMLSLNDNLTRLGLRNISNDDILKTIGQSCLRLVTLDVSVSPNVSDDGMKNLLQYPVDEDVHGRPVRPITAKRARHVFYCETAVKLLPDKIETIDSATLREYCRYPTRLCSTLQTLDVSSTNVSRFGILRAMLTVDNLKSFGEFAHVGKAVDLYDKCTITRTALALTAVKSCRTTADKLQTVCAVCTKLERIVVNGPMFEPFALRVLPETLTKLCLRGVPAEREWVDGLCKYLSQPRARNLRELSLRFESRRTLLTVDLAAFLFRLTKLEVLALHSVETTLPSDRPTVALRRLRSICLGQVDRPRSLRRLLQCVPNLNALHVYVCLGLDSCNVFDLIEAGQNRHLTCFYINELPGGNPHTVTNIVRMYPELASIGNVNNWCVSPLDEGLLSVWLFVNNYKLQFPGNFHWFFSECFPDCQVFL